MVPKGFRPMLGTPVDLEKLVYPVLASPKLDGVRCITFDGVPYSRTLKKIPNRHIQEMFAKTKRRLHGFDGELICGRPLASNVFQATTSAVMSHDGHPPFSYHVFDVVDSVDFFTRTYSISLIRNFGNGSTRFVREVVQTPIKSYLGLQKFEQRCLAAGYEGVIIRASQGPYKYGRSTANEGLLLKLVRWEHQEAVVIGFEEKEHNENKLQRDERGYAKRSSCKDGKRGAGTLGAIIVSSVLWPAEFRIGSGYTDAQRADIWNNKKKYQGELVRFKYNSFGTKDLPRHPIFEGFRDWRDT